MNHNHQLSIHIQCLDKGFLEYEDHMGDDMTVLNAARVSFAKKKSGELDAKDTLLMNYLAEHEHWSPFRHNYLTLRIKAPIFCFRQIMKHRIASDFNEMSGRYAEFEETDFFVPVAFRKQALINKQGSEGELDDVTDDIALSAYLESCHSSMESYKELLKLGVCREQARCVLPVGMYSQAIWTISLQAAVHFIRLRTSDHAQAETREYGEAMKKICMELWPLATTALMDRLPEVK